MSPEGALASLRIWAIEVDVGGYTYRIPPQPASEWMSAILSDEVWPIVPAMLEPEDEELLLDRVLAGEVTMTDVTRANRDAVAAASGWNWWEAERLVVSAAAEWRVVGGLLHGAGVVVDQVSLGALLSAIYAMAVTNMTKEDRFKFDAQLSAPPVGYAHENSEEWFAQTGAEQSFADLLRDVQDGG